MGKIKRSKWIKYNDEQTGLNSTLYQRKNSDGKTEYAYGTAGTNPLDSKDLKADADQLSGKSEQYAQSVGNAVKLEPV